MSFEFPTPDQLIAEQRRQLEAEVQALRERVAEALRHWAKGGFVTVDISDVRVEVIRQVNLELSEKGWSVFHLNPVMEIYESSEWRPYTELIPCRQHP